MFDFFRPTGFICLMLSLITTDINAAGVVGKGTSVSCTDAALTDAITRGGNVSFNCGNLPKTILISSEKIISENTLINGGNLITISGGGAKRLFKVNPNVHFTVNNLTLANGRTADQGAAIHAGSWPNSVLTVNHCNFINNISTRLGEHGGGALFSSGGYLTVDKSTFKKNKAGTGGGIRVVQSNLTVTNSKFIDNKAVDSFFGDGGAIHIDGGKTDNGKIIIQASKFIGNSASNYGGAVFNNILNNNTTTITNSFFSGNSVGGGVNGQGGAIWSRSTGDPKKGGQWVINTNNTKLTINNITVSNNTARNQGGGIWVARHPKGAVISNSTISGNRALTNMGGGIVQADTGKLSVINSTISDNKVSGKASMGAGIYISRNSKATITNATIANNTASWQAGGIFGASNVTLKNTILANNIALNGGNTWNIKHNCFLPMTNGGHNLQFPTPKDADCSPGILIADPKLATLKNNGGFTLTRAILRGSPASRNASGCPATDQRGIKRSKPTGTTCDIGAYEAGF
jgi:predicted outer membrane repeat protein